MTGRRARDIALLDALEAHRGSSFEGSVWRIVREGRNPLEGTAARARWDSGTFDVLYTSMEKDGAFEEVYFHLKSQPVFPSKLVSIANQIQVTTHKTLKLANMDELSKFGILTNEYTGFDYSKSQEIADAANFLGFDGIIAPSARWPCNNLILFTERLNSDDIRVISTEIVDWPQWRSIRNSKRTN